MKKKICCECGKIDFYFSRKRCKSCASKSYGTIKRVSTKQKVKIEEKKELIKQDHQFYLDLFEKHPTKKCVECGVKINGNPFSYNFHHLVPKRLQDKYSVDIRHSRLNIALVCIDCHTQAELYIDKAPRIKNLTEIAKAHFEQFKIN